MLTFPKFWTWLSLHMNCLVRVGTPSAVLADYDDFHWILTEDDDNQRRIQLARAKDIIGELLIPATDIAYVQIESGEFGARAADPGSSDEAIFLCKTTAHEIVCYFITEHKYENGEHTREEKWTH